MFYAPFVARLRLYLSTDTRSSTLYLIFSNMTSISAPTDIELSTMRNATALTEPDGVFDRNSAPQTMGNTSLVDLLSDAASIAVTPDPDLSTAETPSVLPSQDGITEDSAASATGTGVEEHAKARRRNLTTAATVATVSTVGAVALGGIVTGVLFGLEVVPSQ